MDAILNHSVSARGMLLKIHAAMWQIKYSLNGSSGLSKGLMCEQGMSPRKVILSQQLTESSPLRKTQSCSPSVMSAVCNVQPMGEAEFQKEE